MIVTAEPYFAVTRPSNLVVAENIVRQDTAGGIHPISAKFDLLQKGQYTVNIPPDQLPATTADRKTPLELRGTETPLTITKGWFSFFFARESRARSLPLLPGLSE